MLVFNTLKAKLYAVFALVSIAILAYMKWLRASNQAKREKIEELRKEAKTSKKISAVEATTASFREYQRTINNELYDLESSTQSADDARRFDNVKDADSNYTSIRI